MKLILLSCLFVMSVFKKDPCEITVPNVMSVNCESNFYIGSSCHLSFLEIKIFNRWGDKIVELKEQEENSIKKINASIIKVMQNGKVKDGTYFYLLKAVHENDTIIKKGNFALIK